MNKIICLVNLCVSMDKKNVHTKYARTHKICSVCVKKKSIEIIKNFPLPHALKWRVFLASVQI